MIRYLLIVLLAVGVVGGFGAGFMRMRHGGYYGHGYGSGYGECGGWGGREEFERHVAQICADAALKAKASGAAPATGEAAPPAPPAP